MEEKKKYSLLKDAGFWVALFIGTATIFLFMYILIRLQGDYFGGFRWGGFLSKTGFVLTADSILALLTWACWMYYKKGEKSSFLVGFLFWFLILIIGIPLILRFM